VSPPPGARTIDEALAEARTRLRRLTPHQASEAVRAGAVLVDIRPAAQRAEEGEIPGALIIERNVLEWRFDPASDARLPIARYDLHVIVVCSEGYTSSLAAAALQDLGVQHATDLAGGFRAWEAAGLPVTRASLASDSAVLASDSLAGDTASAGHSSVS
jgi:rhodanese-related sulfurtransferase